MRFLPALSPAKYTAFILQINRAERVAEKCCEPGMESFRRFPGKS